MDSFSFKDYLSRKHFCLLLYAFAFLLPFNMLYCNILAFVLFLFILPTLFSGSVSPRSNSWVFYLQFLLFLLQLVGLLYTDDLKSGFFSTEKRLALLLFPLVFFITGYQLEKNELRKLMLYFQAGLFFCILTSLLLALEENYLLNRFSKVDWKIFSDKLLVHVGINHLTYGIYSGFAITSIVLAWMNNDYVSKKLQWFFLLFILIGLMLMVPKMGIISTLCALSYLLLKKGKKASIKQYGIGAAVLVILILIMLQIPKSKERIRQFSYGFARNNVVNDQTSYSAVRAGAFYASLDLIRENWLMGVGTGGIDKAMGSWFSQRKVDNLLGIDTHNQYFDFWLSYGIVGLVLFVGSLLFPFSLASKEGFVLYGAFLIMMIASFSTENFLNNNKGVMFFSFFNSLFAGILQPNKNVVRTES